MTYIIRLILSTLVLCSTTYADARIFGDDFLAAQHPLFDAREAVKYVSPGSALGTLDTTFGTSFSNLDILLSSGKYVFHRFHILNTTCVRNRNCGDYEIVAGYTIASLNRALEEKNQNLLTRFKARVLAYRIFFDQYPNVKPLLSPALEHDMTKPAWRTLADSAREVWPNIQLVNSPDKGIAIESYLGAWPERHGQNPGSAVITSLDGEDITDIQIKGWTNRTKTNRITFRWSRSFNCRNQGPFQDPRSRTSCPKGYQFEEIAHSTDAVPATPKSKPPQCKTVERLSDKVIWKPMAEDKGNGDRRANLPVLIIKGKNQNPFEVVNFKGNVLGKLGYYGPYEDGRGRWYSNWGAGTGENGYKWQKEAVASSGSPWVYLKQGTYCVGPLVTGRRQGSFR